MTANSDVTTDPLVVQISEVSTFSTWMTVTDSFCDGPATYSASPDPAWLTEDGAGSYTISTSDISLRGTTTNVVITISLTNYPTISDTVSLNVMFITCEDVSIVLDPSTWLFSDDSIDVFDSVGGARDFSLML